MASETSGTSEGRRPRDPHSTLDPTAQIEPFDSFWEGPEDVEKGYATFYQFYRRNYLDHVPADRAAPILVVSCGPGYFVEMLVRHGFRNVIGIDSDQGKVDWAKRRALDCRAERAFPFLSRHEQAFEAIVCEQEINHLTKPEIQAFLGLCRDSLKPGGTLIVHALNGANPLTGSEALAQNFDHYNTFTEYSLRQVLERAEFSEVKVIPLNLYVFFGNPLNWIAWIAAGALTLLFRAAFVLYGKRNRFFTKKIAAVCKKPASR
jgi:SAM-dependent methyltransferase